MFSKSEGGNKPSDAVRLLQPKPAIANAQGAHTLVALQIRRLRSLDSKLGTVITFGQSCAAQISDENLLESQVSKLTLFAHSVSKQITTRELSTGNRSKMNLVIIPNRKPDEDAVRLFMQFLEVNHDTAVRLALEHSTLEEIAYTPMQELLDTGLEESVLRNLSARARLVLKSQK